jgi:hypothetical protein
MRIRVSQGGEARYGNKFEFQVLPRQNKWCARYADEGVYPFTQRQCGTGGTVPGKTPERAKSGDHQVV